MTRSRLFLSRLLGAFRTKRQDAELQREIAAHLDEATDDYIRRGLSCTDARRAALIDFGGVARTEDAYRDDVSFRWLSTIKRDVRHAGRSLRRSAGFACVVILVLAMGVGASTAVFVLLNGIVLRPLAFPDSRQLVAITHAVPGRNLQQAGISDGLFFFYSQHAQSLESIGLYTASAMRNLQAGSATTRIEMRTANPAFFKILGVQPAFGRLFTEEDAAPGFLNGTWAIPILLTHDFWVDQFGSDRAVVGRTLSINDTPRLVVGVLPAGFAFPDAHTQIWILGEPSAKSAHFARSFFWKAVARVRPGVTASTAQADLVRVLERIAGVYVDATPESIATLRVSPIVTPLKTAVIGDVAQVLWPLLGGVVCLLLIAAANAGSLFLARVEHRRREIAVRRALGADWRHIASQFFIEAVVLSITAAVLGLGITRILLRTVITLAPIDLPRAGEAHLDWTAVAFALVAAIAIAAVYAAMSLRRLGRSSGDFLRNGQWATGASPSRIRDPFIVLQTALALALMAGSALMVKTYENLSRTALGFSPASVLTVEISLPFRQSGRHTLIYQGLVDRIRHLPGVIDASAASFLPLTPADDMFPVEAGGEPIRFKFFVPGFFQALGTRIVEGDGFGPNVHPTSPYPVLVSAPLARHLFPDGHAVGHQILRLDHDGTPLTMGSRTMGSRTVPPFTIAGIVGDVREAALRGDPTEVVYIPLIDPPVEQSIVPTDITLVVRTAGDPLGQVAAVRQVVSDIDPALGIGRVRTMDAIVAAARGKETFVGVLLLLAAAVAFLLGIVGIYGAVADVVRHRTREIGIRIALGARRAEVIQLVTAGSMWAVAGGAALGVALAAAGTGVLRALLFGVAVRDVVAALASVTVILLASATLAACAAAWRAVRITPLLAMRDD